MDANWPWRLNFIRWHPNACGFLGRNLLHVSLLADGILRCVVDCSQNGHTLDLRSVGSRIRPFSDILWRALRFLACLLLWLRHCATNRKVACSIPDGVIGIFHWHNPFEHTMALGSSLPLTEMSSRNTSWWVKAAGAYHLHVPIVLKSWNVSVLEPSGPLQPCTGILYLYRTVFAKPDLRCVYYYYYYYYY